MTLFFKSFLMGALVSIPVGPIAIFCMRKTLTNGLAAGIASGLGAAVVDAIYAYIASVGFGFISALLLQQKVAFTIFGSLFLLLLGIKIFLTKPNITSAPTDGAGIMGSFLATLFITATNPLTILSFLALFATFGHVDKDFSSLTQLMAGIFLGSFAWYCLLSGAVSLIRHKFTEHTLMIVNKITGVVLALFGVAALLNLLR